MINGINVNSSFKGLVSRTLSNKWVQAALFVGTATAGAFFIKENFFSKGKVRFRGKTEYLIETSPPELLPSGYLVRHPQRGACMVIIEKKYLGGLIIRFQDEEKEEIEEGDFFPVTLNEFKTWEPVKKW